MRKRRVPGPEGLADVGQVGGGPGRVDPSAGRGLGDEDRGQQHIGRQQGCQRRGQSQETPREEGAVVNAAGPVGLTDQQRGDQPAGEDEEDVHAQRAAGHIAAHVVEADDAGDRQGPQPVQARLVFRGQGRPLRATDSPTLQASASRRALRRPGRHASCQRPEGLRTPYCHPRKRVSAYPGPRGQGRRSAAPGSRLFAALRPG